MWSYEIVGNNEEVLVLWPKEGWTNQGGLRTVVSLGPKINDRSEASAYPS
jgi:hypothetical protein